jgi:hypothetical protein
VARGTVTDNEDFVANEGTDCDTENLEDTEDVQADIFEGEGTQLFLNLRNSGSGGGDSAVFTLDVFNEQAP